MIHSPSKYTGLARLKQIQKDNCQGETGKEYDESEVLALIAEKEVKNTEAMMNVADKIAAFKAKQAQINALLKPDFSSLDKTIRIAETNRIIWQSQQKSIFGQLFDLVANF